MTASIPTNGSRAGAIFRVTSGNFLEQFDFFLFGFYATQIAAVFFPASSEFASLMMTFAVFGAGFLMRPLGAIVLGETQALRVLRLMNTSTNASRQPRSVRIFLGMKSQAHSVSA